MIKITSEALCLRRYYFAFYIQLSPIFDSGIKYFGPTSQC